MKTTVVHLMPTLMERQLDPNAAYLLQKAIEKRGIEVLTEANTNAVLGDSHVTGVRLEGGRTLPADLVVMAVGIRPNTLLAKEAGLEVKRGIVVDDHLRTSDPNIFAVGECVEHRGQCYGLVAPLYEMAKALAATLAGEPVSGYAGSATSTKLKVTGVDLFSAGDFSESDEKDEIVLRDPSRGVYKRIVLRDNRVVGAVLYGDTADGSWYFDLLQQEHRHHRDARHAGVRPGLSGRRDARPTGSRGRVAGRRRNLRLQRRLQGRDHAGDHRQGPDHASTTFARKPKHQSSCGQCTAKVESLLSVTLGDKYAAAGRKPMCKCIDLTHEEVRGFIVAKELKSLPAVMQELGWKTSCGCPTCRPALNYYLLCAWPFEYRDDAQSRFINERVHANIQKDGTYLGGPAHVGRAHHARRAARHRRRRRQLQDPDREGHRRPAHRPARRQEGRPSRRVGATSTPPGWSPATLTPRACAR